MADREVGRQTERVPGQAELSRASARNGFQVGSTSLLLLFGILESDQRLEPKSLLQD